MLLMYRDATECVCSACTLKCNRLSTMVVILMIMNDIFGVVGAVCVV